MLRKYLFWVLCLLSLSAQKLPAFFCENWGNISVYGEWLYFRPSIDVSLLHRSNGFFSENAESLKVVPRFHSGWRVGVGYQFPNCEDVFVLDWSQLNTSDTKNYSTGTVIVLPTQSFTVFGGIAREKLECNYYTLNSLLRHHLLSRSCFNLNLLAGIQYSWVNVKERVDITGAVVPPNSIFVKENSHFWGLGPEIGFDFLYALWGNLSLTGKARGIVLVSRPKARLRGSGSTAFSKNFTSDPYWKLVPAWDFNLGLQYEFCLRCTTIYLEGGFETISYVRPLHLSLPLASAFGPFDESNFDMFGFYLGACIRF